ncbi:MAG: helix-turn-helix transcriptional regulator [Gemmatimonadaceae bacterium]
MSQPSPEQFRGTRDDGARLGAGDARRAGLRTLAWGPRHGYAVARWIKDTSRDALVVEDRALYVSLHRLEERGYVESEWGLSESNRKAKYHRLTAQGRRQLRQEPNGSRNTSTPCSACCARSLRGVRDGTRPWNSTALRLPDSSALIEREVNDEVAFHIETRRCLGRRWSRAS